MANRHQLRAPLRIDQAPDAGLSVQDFTTLTALYDAQDAGGLETDVLYRIQWSGDSYAPDGEILCMWDGAALYPDPLTQVEFPSWLIDSSEWSFFTTATVSSLTKLDFDGEGRPQCFLDVRESPGGDHAIVLADPTRYGRPYNYLNARCECTWAGGAVGGMGAGLAEENGASVPVDWAMGGIGGGNRHYSHVSVNGSIATDDFSFHIYSAGVAESVRLNVMWLQFDGPTHQKGCVSSLGLATGELAESLYSGALTGGSLDLLSDNHTASFGPMIRHDSNGAPVLSNTSLLGSVKLQYIADDNGDPRVY